MGWRGGGLFGVAALLWSNCNRDSFGPPEVEKGEPVCFSPDLSPAPWVSETRSDKRKIWFKVLDDGKWYIDWDQERQPLKFIVVHHSATGFLFPFKKIVRRRIEWTHRRRLYRSRYQSRDEDPFIEGLPIHSAHVVNGKERFIAYHHLIYKDGEITTELKPLGKIKGQWFVDMIAWHSGEWEVNCSSIAICLIGDFTRKGPSSQQFEALKKLIEYYRQFNTDLEVKAHYEINPTTECPGPWWQRWSEKF